jgi:hypothetical protein
MGETGDGETGSADEDRATIVHFFGETTLGPLEETQPCVSWTIGNEEAVYVEKTDLFNQGMYHHSTWMAVPEDMFEGPDGFWNCSDRGWDEVQAALAGTVLIAQSTQSLWEEQQYGPDDGGVVVKIPPFHKIVAVNHMLNVTDREITTGITMTLNVVHPKLVQTVLTPFRLAFWDLFIPPAEGGVPTESDHVADCDIAGIFSGNGIELDAQIHFLLPHTHQYAKRFFVDIVGGPRDGDRIIDIDGFSAQGNGTSFFPPVDMTGATGLRMTCGYANDRDEPIVWGVGDQEMCEMLGMADSSLVFDMGVNTSVLEDDGVVKTYGGNCSGVGFYPNSKQTLPSQGEIDGDLYLPDVPPGDQGLPDVPECEDVDASVPGEGPVTLTSLRNTLFQSCAWSSCHTGDSPRAGLDLGATDLHAELLRVSQTDPGRQLVDPGNPDESWLLHRVSKCEPTSTAGEVYGHMPFGSPVLLEDALVNKLRQWIADGAPDN